MNDTDIEYENGNYCGRNNRMDDNSNLTLYVEENKEVADKKVAVHINIIN